MKTFIAFVLLFSFVLAPQAHAMSWPFASFFKRIFSKPITATTTVEIAVPAKDIPKNPAVPVVKPNATSTNDASKKTTVTPVPIKQPVPVKSVPKAMESVQTKSSNPMPVKKTVTVIASPIVLSNYSNQGYSYTFSTESLYDKVTIEVACNDSQIFLKGKDDMTCGIGRTINIYKGSISPYPIYFGVKDGVPHEVTVKISVFNKNILVGTDSVVVTVNPIAHQPIALTISYTNGGGAFESKNTLKVMYEGKGLKGPLSVHLMAGYKGEVASMQVSNVSLNGAGDFEFDLTKLDPEIRYSSAANEYKLRVCDESGDMFNPPCIMIDSFTDLI